MFRIDNKCVLTNRKVESVPSTKKVFSFEDDLYSLPAEIPRVGTSATT